MKALSCWCMCRASSLPAHVGIMIGFCFGCGMYSVHGMFVTGFYRREIYFSLRVPIILKLWLFAFGNQSCCLVSHDGMWQGTTKQGRQQGFIQNFERGGVISMLPVCGGGKCSLRTGMSLHPLRHLFVTQLNMIRLACISILKLCACYFPVKNISLQHRAHNVNARKGTQNRWWILLHISSKKGGEGFHFECFSAAQN